MDPLAAFDSRIRTWFSSRFGEPTDIQVQAWPRIAAGEHVLATAPTGSGKTLAAFLWALDRFATGRWERGAVRVLYVSPLKALNNDIGRNLLAPLRELELDDVSVAVRSGDTPQSERQRMLRRPPEILVTTPESLNLLLASPRGRTILHGIRSVILDEIHAVAGGKRGTYLMTAVERLVPLCGEFQRIALSATVKPLDTIAAFVGGVGRRVEILQSSDEKELKVSVCSVEREPSPESVWPLMTEEFRKVVHGNRATLFFVNNRALCERIVRWLNDGEEQPVAYAHHGSISRELRALVETKLKDGELKALVATSSLELGIDVGTLDEVVLVQSPRTLTSAVQRVGRAGHDVGATSRGRIYPTFGRDFLDAAVLAPLVEARECETLRPVRAPLDVLAQVIVAMCGVAERDLDDVYALLCRSWPYRDLQQAAFDRVVAMLRGRYADTRIRELRPRLRIDPETGRARGADGVLPLLYRSGGVIPDRGYFAVRVQGSGARLGELDEEFVWERRVGQEITIGAQLWRIQRISRNDVEVVPGTGDRPIHPFWKAEQAPRGFELAEHIGRFLAEANDRLDDPAFRERLLQTHRLDEGAADTLLEFLRRQKAVTGADLPHRRHLLVEHYQDKDFRGESKQVMLHASWGDAVWRPFSIALSGAWEARYGAPLGAFSGDDGLLVHLPHEFSVDHLLDMVDAGSVETHLRRRLEQTGFFGARFRECAGRALLLPRHRGGERMPLWLNRLRAKKLMQAVRGYKDFPILAEAWRTSLEDEFDLGNLRALLDELATGAIRVTEVATKSPSPFAEGLAWRSTNYFMYDEYERAPAAPGASLGDDVLREVLHDASLRPRLDPALVRELEGKLQRTAEGYVPDDPAEWFDLVEERLLVPPWGEELPRGLELHEGWVVSSAQLPRIRRARSGEEHALLDLVGRFLQTYGPVTLAYLEECWGVPLAATLARLVEQGTVLAVEDGKYCDAENLERLLRMQRSRRRPSFTPLPLARLPQFVAAHQGVGGAGDLHATLEQLFGYAAPAALWEEAILPARGPFAPGDLDLLLQESDLIWFGAGRERTGFCFQGDARLFLEPVAAAEFVPEGRHDFFELQAGSGLDSAELTTRLWDLVWAGGVVNDTYAVLRRGLANSFKPAAPTRTRRGLNRWQSSRPLAGTWRPLRFPAPTDRLEEAEDDKDRARQLLARYGVLCRALCSNELPALRWGRLVRTLRLLELSGEVMAGRFFTGIDGLQFATPGAFRRLGGGLDDGAVYRLNACDPASLCGTGLIAELPPRVPSTWLVYEGARLVLVARRSGRQLEIRDGFGPSHLAALDGRGMVVEEIDGETAARSPVADLFREAGFRDDMGRLVLERSV